MLRVQLLQGRGECRETTSSASSPSSLTCTLLGETEMPVGMDGLRTPSTSHMASSPRCRFSARGRRWWLAGWGKIVSKSFLSTDPSRADLANQDMLNNSMININTEQVSARLFMSHFECLTKDISEITSLLWHLSDDGENCIFLELIRGLF